MSTANEGTLRYLEHKLSGILNRALSICLSKDSMGNCFVSIMDGCKFVFLNVMLLKVQPGSQLNLRL